jgi:hypothetical protein
MEFNSYSRDFGSHLRRFSSYQERLSSNWLLFNCQIVEYLVIKLKKGQISESYYSKKSLAGY